MPQPALSSQSVGLGLLSPSHPHPHALPPPPRSAVAFLRPLVFTAVAFPPLPARDNELDRRACWVRNVPAACCTQGGQAGSIHSTLPSSGSASGPFCTFGSFYLKCLSVATPRAASLSLGISPEREGVLGSASFFSVCTHVGRPNLGSTLGILLHVP